MDYFGNNSAGLYSDSTMPSRNRWNVDANLAYICPGSGLQDVNELGGKFKVSSGTANVRLAIYTAAGNFVMQGNSEVSVSSTTGDWYSHTSFVDQAGSAITSPQLTGGEHYELMCSGDGSNSFVFYNTATSGYCKYGYSDYTGGFPSTIGAGTDTIVKPCVRCGVTAAAAAGSLGFMLMMDHFNGGYLHG